MISIIVSSYQPEFFEKFKRNVAETIGVEYEIIKIINFGEFGICEAYNKGSIQAQFPFLCFAHEDIDIKTNNWGQIICELFKSNANIGVIGVAGASYKPGVPSGWTFPGSEMNSLHVNYIQSDKNSVHKSIHYLNNPRKEALSIVVSVDGMWFCTRKHIALEFPFDERTFKNFHCYDVDFCLSVCQKYNVAVTFNILIEHLSLGSFNKEWINETFKLHEKWINKLPINLAGIEKQQQIWEEERAFMVLLEVMLKNNYMPLSTYKILWSKSLRSLLSLKAFAKINLILTKAVAKKLITNKL